MSFSFDVELKRFQNGTLWSSTSFFRLRYKNRSTWSPSVCPVVSFMLWSEMNDAVTSNHADTGASSLCSSGSQDFFKSPY